MTCRHEQAGPVQRASRVPTATEAAMVTAWTTGAALSAVGAAGGVSATTAWRLIRQRLGMPPRPLARALTAQQRAQIVSDFTSGQMTTAACAALHRIAPETVRVILRAAGVPPRPSGRPPQTRLRGGPVPRREKG
jgi:hypothetical protein